MTLESTKSEGPASALAKYSTIVDAFELDATSLLDELLRKRNPDDPSNFSAALLAVLAYAREGWDSVRVGFADSFATQTYALLNFVSNRVAFRNSANTAYADIRCGNIAINSAGATIDVCTGTPEGQAGQEAVVGSIRLRDDGGAGTTFYVKESGTGNTGWVAK